MIQIRMSPQDSDLLLCNVATKSGLYCQNDTKQLKYYLPNTHVGIGWTLDPLHLERYSILVCELSHPDDLVNFPELFL